MMKWTGFGDDREDVLVIFTPTEFNALPDNLQFEAVDGTFAVKGVDYIDMDTRNGHIAYGIRSFETAHRDLYLILLLTKPY